MRTPQTQALPNWCSPASALYGGLGTPLCARFAGHNSRVYAVHALAVCGHSTAWALVQRVGTLSGGTVGNPATAHGRPRWVPLGAYILCTLAPAASPALHAARAACATPATLPPVPPPVLQVPT